MPRLTLKAKMMLTIVGLSLTAFGFFGLIAYQGAQTMREGKEKQVQTGAKALLDKIERNLFERYGDVQAYALSEPARSGDPARITAFINDMMPTYAPIYDLMVVVNAKGIVTAVNTVDKGGKPLPTAALIGRDYSQKNWFKVAMSGGIAPGTSYVEDLHIDEDVAGIYKNPGRVMTFTAPIRDKVSGDIIGVWNNKVSWRDVIEAITLEETKELTSESIPRTFVYLFGRDGTYLMHPAGEEYELKGKTKDSLPTEAGQVIMSHKEITTKDFEDRVVEAVTRSKGYSSYPGIGWSLALQVPEKDPQTTANLIFITLAALSLVCGGAVAYAVMRRVVVSLDGVNTRLSHEAAGIKSASDTVSSASQALADAAEQQASALQETAASIEEMAAMIKRSMENASQCVSFSSASEGASNSGKEAVGQMTVAMAEINDSTTGIMRQVEASNQRLMDITKVIAEIGAKTNVINDIVFQTKLLSFNASVEAARAGEHGKGFAVVAEEIGNLARMSGEASREISSMLSQSTQVVNDIVHDTKAKIEGLIGTSRVKTESGTAIAAQCAVILEEVVRNVRESNVLVAGISSAMNEQSQGISEINAAMNKLDQVTQVNAVTSQKTAVASAELKDQAQALSQAASTLNFAIKGSYVAEDSSVSMAAPPVKEELSLEKPGKVTPLRVLNNPEGTPRRAGREERSSPSRRSSGL